MLSSLKEAAAKQAAKLKEVIDEASHVATADAAAKRAAEGDQNEELAHLRVENEALKARLREAMTPPSEREKELEQKLQAKIQEHDKLAEKSRELMLRYRKLQTEKSQAQSPMPASPANDNNGLVGELRREIEALQSELEVLRSTHSQPDKSLVSPDDETQEKLRIAFEENSKKDDALSKLQSEITELKKELSASSETIAEGQSEKLGDMEETLRRTLEEKTQLEKAHKDALTELELARASTNASAEEWQSRVRVAEEKASRLEDADDERQAKLFALEERCRQLESELVRSTPEESGNRQPDGSNEDAIEVLKAQIAQAANVEMDLRVALDRAERQASTSTASLKGLEQKLAEVFENVSSLEDSLREAESSKKQALDAAATEVEQLKLELVKVSEQNQSVPVETEELDTLRRALAESKESENALRDQMAKLKAELDAFQHQAGRTEQEESDYLRKALAESKESENALRDEVNKLSAEVNSLLHQAGQNDQTSTMKLEELDSVKSLLAQSQESETTLRDENERLLSAVENLKREKEQIGKVISAESEELSSVKEALAQSQSSEEALRGEITNLSAELAALKNSNDSKDMEDIRTALLRSQTEEETLRQQLALMTPQLDGLRAQLESHNNVVDDSVLLEKEQNIERQNQEIIALRTEIDQLSGLIATKETQCQELQVNQQKLEQSLEESQNNILQMTSEKELTDSAEEALKSRLAELSENVLQLNEERRVAQEAQRYAEDRASSLETQFATVTASLHRLEQDKGLLEQELALKSSPAEADMFSIDDANREVDLRVTLDRTERSLLKALARIREFESSSQNIGGTAGQDKFNEKIRVLSEREVDLRVALERTERKLFKCEQEKKDAIAKAEESTEIINDLSEQVRVRESAVLAAKQELDALLKEREGVQQKLDEAEIAVAQLALVEARAKGFEAELSGVKPRLEKLKQLEAHVKELEAQLADTEARAAKLVEIETIASIAVQNERSANQQLEETMTRLKQLEQEQQNRGQSLDAIRAEAMQGREELLERLREKEAALTAAEETMRKLASSFDQRSAEDQDLRQELEAERVRAEETEMKLRAEFDKAKLEMQQIFEVKAKALEDQMQEAKLEAEAAQVACLGFQRQMNEALNDAINKQRELDSLKERTRDALLKINEEKKDLQDRLLTAQTSLERKEKEPPPEALPPPEPIVDPVLLEEIENLKRQKAEVEEAHDATKQLCATIEHELAALRVELQATQSVIKSSEAAEQRVLAENARLRDDMVALKQDIKARRERAEKVLAERDAQIERLTERLNRLQGTSEPMVPAEEEHDEAINEAIEDLRKQVDEKQEELQRATTELTVLRRKLHEQQLSPSHGATLKTPAKHPDDPTAAYLKNALLNYMCSRDTREQLGMVKAISQLAGFSQAETERIRKTLEGADQGVLGKFMGSVMSLTSQEQPASSASPAPNQRVMKRVG